MIIFNKEFWTTMNGKQWKSGIWILIKNLNWVEIFITILKWIIIIIINIVFDREIKNNHTQWIYIWNKINVSIIDTFINRYRMKTKTKTKNKFRSRTTFNHGILCNFFFYSQHLKLVDLHCINLNGLKFTWIERNRLSIDVNDEFIQN